MVYALENAVVSVVSEMHRQFVFERVIDFTNQPEMASYWWSLWPFSKGASSSSTANFLHLSRANIERICELTLDGKLLNPHQCRSMSSKLARTMRSIERIVDLVDIDANVVYGCTALENFYRVSEKGKGLAEACCRVDWCQAAAFQIQNEEAFNEIVLETSLCYNTICEVVKDISQNRELLFEDLRYTATFDPPSADEVLRDRAALRDRLKELVTEDANYSPSGSHIRSRHLAMYLMRRPNHTLYPEHSTVDVQNFNLWSDGKGPDGEWGEKEEYLGGNVCKTTWLDVPCAKKIFKDEMQEDEWRAEAKILSVLNHPNIVKFLCCNKYEAAHSWGHFIAMEQMETSLGSFLRRLKAEGTRVSLFSALDIMGQIAYGMCYLHENGIAHRDLKTSNVVVRRVSAPNHLIQSYLQVKVVDFGLSKVKVQDKSSTVSRPKIGTTLYMPPEAFLDGKANWFKADVYSFSAMCSVILSGNEPFQDVKRTDLYGAISSGKRPELPADVPKELAALIMEGWASDRNLRPSFFDICTRLEKLRHRLLRIHSFGMSLKQEEQVHSDLYIERMLKRRQLARKHCHSQVRVQAIQHVTGNLDNEEWFDGVRDQGQQQVSFKAEEVQQQRSHAEIVYAGPVRHRPDQDAVEAGRNDYDQIYMLGHDGKCTKAQWQFNSGRSSGDDGVTPSKPKSEVEAVEDEMVSWLQYPLDATLERSFSSEFFGELSPSSPQLMKESFGHNPVARPPSSCWPSPFMLPSAFLPPTRPLARRPSRDHTPPTHRATTLLLFDHPPPTPP